MVATRLLPLIVALLVPSGLRFCLGHHLFFPGLDRSIFCSGQPYHRDWTGMGQDQSGLPRIRSWVATRLLPQDVALLVPSELVA